MLGFRFLNLGRWRWWYDQDQGARVQITVIRHNITVINIINMRLLHPCFVITRKTFLIVVIIDENVSGDLEDIVADIALAVIGPVRAEILLKLTDILTGRHKIVTPAPAINEINEQFLCKWLVRLLCLTTENVLTSIIDTCLCQNNVRYVQMLNIGSQTWGDPFRVCDPFQGILGDGETKRTFSPFFLFSCWTLYWHAVTDWVNWISYSQYFVGSHGELSAGIELQSDDCNTASRVSGPCCVPLVKWVMILIACSRLTSSCLLGTLCWLSSSPRASGW